MDSSKAFNTPNHKLLIIKLNADDFNNESSKWIPSYLTNRYQRTNINKNVVRWINLLQGVTQVSALDPCFFHIYLDSLFFLVDYTKVCNFADDTSFFPCDKGLEALINRFLSENDSVWTTEWLLSNYMKLNGDKCHLLVGGCKYESIYAKIGDARIWESKAKKYLGYI